MHTSINKAMANMKVEKLKNWKLLHVLQYLRVKRHLLYCHVNIT